MCSMVHILYGEEEAKRMRARIMETHPEKRYSRESVRMEGGNSIPTYENVFAAHEKCTTLNEKPL